MQGWITVGSPLVVSCLFNGHRLSRAPFARLEFDQTTINALPLPRLGVTSLLSCFVSA